MKTAWILSLFLFIQPIKLDGSLIISHQGRALAVVSRSDFSFPFPVGPMINIDNYNLFIDKIDKQISQAPVSAKIDDQGRIVPEQAGYMLDRQNFAKHFYHYYFKPGSSMIEVPTLPIYPRVDSELLSQIREKVIGYYITYFNANNKNRAHNIDLAVEAINNYVLFPGETFSFNHIVGKRTMAKGYLPAPVIVKGELSEGIGGGICQVSSTLFNAVDKAGVHILERYSHSKRVQYVPEGRDATVSWYGPDFRFKNSYNQPLLIRAKSSGGRVSILIYSSELINFKPRKISRASNLLPKETKVDSNTKN